MTETTRGVLARVAQSDAELLQRMVRARDEGDFAPEHDPQALVTYLKAVLQGMGVLATSGAGAEQLRSLVDTTLAM